MAELYPPGGGKCKRIPCGSAVERARAFLRFAVPPGSPVPAVQILELARAAGFASGTVEAAKRREGIRSRRNGYGRGARFYWFSKELLQVSPW